MFSVARPVDRTISGFSVASLRSLGIHSGEYVTEEEFIVRYVALYSVGVTDGIYWVIRSFLWNPALLDHYWELAGQTCGDGDLS